ncbi:Zn(II)2Cys6 transcription factor domain-containing protein [Aspergillus foveolatus]|uniref:Zn(II)2Cys6 transcription factor domain-containing protein n=1 Tax=Aspergillus foveolatus TaxID=210207 RepID=UPI003CCD5501
MTLHTPISKQRSLRRPSRVRCQAPRASQACEGCAIAKVRCDNNKTCLRCRRRQISCIRPWPLEGEESQSVRIVDGLQPEGMAHLRPGNANPAPSQTPEADMQQSLPSLAFSDLVNCHLEDLNYLADLLIQSSAQNQQSLQGSHHFLDNTSSVFPAGDLDMSLLPGLYPSSSPPSGSTLQTVKDQSESPHVLDAFEKTVGRWNPDLKNHRAAEEPNLSLGPGTGWIENHLEYPSVRVSDDRLSPETRDRILAMVLHTCESANVIHVVSAFPAANMLERLLHRFCEAHASDDDSWIHIPTLRSSETPPELLAACITAAAIRSSSTAVRRFGSALHGVLHPYLFQIFEKQIAQTRQLQQIQALALYVQTGLWSGSKRRMEIASAIVGSVVTMLRSGRRYRASTYSNAIPDPDDDGDVLEKKWHLWAEQESWKRQESLVTGSRTPVSYAELSLPFPEHRQLWMARSANQWLRAYIQLQGLQQRSHNSRQPCLRDYIADPLRLQTIPPLYDSSLAYLTVLHAVGSMIKARWQERNAMPSEDSDTFRVFILADESSQNRLAHLLHHIRILYDDEYLPDHPGSNLTVELLSMHYLTPFDQIEVLAGREGPGEAEAVLPLLDRWCQTPEARKAVWHASQVIRCLHHLPAENFTEFFTVAAYQASLCLYIYGAMARSQASKGISDASNARSKFQLDAADSPAIRRWITLGSGTPMLGFMDSASSPQNYLSLDATRAILLCVRNLLDSKASQKNLSPLVTGICDLIHALSNTKQRYP